MKYQINSTGAVILADAAFMEQYHAGDYTLVAEVETPTSKRVLTKLEYMNRFTDSELAAIYTAAKTVVQVEIWLEKFKAATEVNLDDLVTVAGLDALEAAGLIGEGRSAEIRQ